MTTGRSVFLTGGTGFLGVHLRKELSNRGYQVTLLVREETSVKERPDETVLRGDITDPSTFEITEDSVIHLAASTSVPAAVENPRETWVVNADGTLNVLEEARKADIQRFCYMSTASVYGLPVYLPIDEDHPPTPAEPYGASKLSGDRLAVSYGHSYELSTVVIRAFNLFGPGQPGYNVVPTIIRQAYDGGSIELGNLTPERDFLYVKDAVRGIIVAFEEGNREEVYNLGRGEAVSIGTLAEKITSQFDRQITVRSTMDRQRDENIEIQKHVADVAKLNSLGWEPTYSLEEGLAETVEKDRESTNITDR